MDHSGICFFVWKLFKFCRFRLLTKRQHLYRIRRFSLELIQVFIAKTVNLYIKQNHGVQIANIINCNLIY